MPKLKKKRLKKKKTCSNHGASKHKCTRWMVRPALLRSFPSSFCSMFRNIKNNRRPTMANVHTLQWQQQCTSPDTKIQKTSDRCSQTKVLSEFCAEHHWKKRHQHHIHITPIFQLCLFISFFHYFLFQIIIIIFVIALIFSYSVFVFS